MKRLGLMFILGIVLVLLASCGSEDNKVSNSGSSSSKDGGAITIGLTGDPSVLNPLYTGDRVSLTIQQALYAPLFYTDGGKVEPALAESLEASDDNLTYILKLKNGLKWHDGERLTADDIIFTMDSIMDEKQNSWIRGSFVFDNQTVSYKKVDDTTVKFKLPIVAPAFASALEALFPIPEHVFKGEKDLQKSAKNDHPIGSGPFKFVEYKPSQYVKLERFDDYYAGKSHLDNVIFKIVKDENSAALALKNDEINLKSLQPTEVKTVSKNEQVEIVKYPEYRLVYLAMNHNVEAIKNKKFRQALSYALDREEIIKAAYGSTEYAEPAYSIFTKDVKYLASNLAQYDQDLDKAKQLIKESGVNLKSKNLNLIYANNNKAFEGISLYLQQQFKKIGVNLVLEPGDANAVFTKAEDRKSKDYAFLLNGYIMGAEPDAYKLLFESDAAYNYSNYKNEELDKLWTKGATTANGPERERIYHNIQSIIADDAAIYPISYNYNVFAIDKRYGGIDEAKPIPVTIVRDLSKIYLK